MKKHTLIALATVSIAATSQAALTTDLVGYYDFETDLANKALGASGTDGSWIGTQTLSQAGFTGNAAFNPGDGLSDRSTLLVGNALNIVDAENTLVDIPFSSTDLGTTFTISIWTYLAPGATNGSARFHALEGSNSYDVSWGTDGSYSTTGRNDYDAFVDTTNVAFNNQFDEEEWDHVLMTYTTSGSTADVSVYLNGSTTAITGTDTSATFTFGSLYVGDSRAGSGERDWDGMIDEVALWTRDLTTAERTQVYQNGLNGLAVTVPEPSSTALLGLGGLALILRRRK